MTEPRQKLSNGISNLVQGTLSLVSDYGNEVPENFAHVICQPETALRKRSRKVSVDRSGFRGLDISQEAILSDPACRRRPSLRLESRQESAVLCGRDRNRILASHARRDPAESLAMRNFPTPLRNHRNALRTVRRYNRNFVSK